MKDMVDEVNVSIFIKNTYIKYKLYRLGKSKEKIDNAVIIFFEDGYRKRHGGLMDRMKAIVGAYYLAKRNNMQFRIVFTTPFDLEKYLMPNKVNWTVEKKDISYKLGDVHFFNLCMDKNGNFDVPDFRDGRQNHCYFSSGHDIIYKEREDWMEVWHNLYHELFRKSMHLERLLEECKLPKDYIAVHIRFINMLEKFEERSFGEGELKEHEKKIILDRIFKVLEMISLSHMNEELFVFSDSAVFIAEALKLGYKTIMPEKQIGHISFNKNDESHDKTFIDFYAMAGSNKVYAIRGMGLYTSVFSLYAAVVGKQNYQFINLDDLEQKPESSFK